MSDSIYSLNESNRQIRNLLIQILNNNNSSHNSHNNFNRRNYSRYSQRNTVRENARSPSTNTSTGANGLGRIYLNNRPYIIDNLQHYNIPLNRENANNNNLSQILQNFFQPVEVFPTQTQIESATRNVRYCDILSPRNRSCPISLENFNDTDIVSIIRFCGHIFNTEQLNTWFRSNCRCPVCRYDIRRYNSTASSEFFNSSESSAPDANTIPSATQTLSNPLDGTENNSTNSNEERNRQTTSGRTNNALLFFNTILDNFSNTSDINLSDINLSGIESIGEIFTDLSGNDTSNVIYNLLNEFNTRTTR
jgi:hypothetical protein